MPRPTVRERLLAEYDALEDAIDTSARAEIWKLADWLLHKVDRSAPGPRGRGDTNAELRISDLAGRRGRSEQWLRTMRRVAEATHPNRLPRVSVRAYQKALENADWNLAAANAAIEERGTRLRDHGAVESATAIRNQALQLPASDRVELVTALLNDDPDGLASAAGPDDLDYGLAVIHARSAVENQRQTRTDERERVRHERSADEQAFERLKGEVRMPHFGEGERIMMRMEDPTIAADWLQEQKQQAVEGYDHLILIATNRAPDTVPPNW